MLHHGLLGQSLLVVPEAGPGARVLPWAVRLHHVAARRGAGAGAVIGQNRLAAPVAVGLHPAVANRVVVKSFRGMHFVGIVISTWYHFGGPAFVVHGGVGRGRGEGVGSSLEGRRKRLFVTRRQRSARVAAVSVGSRVALGIVRLGGDVQGLGTSRLLVYVPVIRPLKRVRHGDVLSVVLHRATLNPTVQGPGFLRQRSGSVQGPPVRGRKLENPSPGWCRRSAPTRRRRRPVVGQPGRVGPRDRVAGAAGAVGGMLVLDAAVRVVRVHAVDAGHGDVGRVVRGRRLDAVNRRVRRLVVQTEVLHARGRSERRRLGQRVQPATGSSALKRLVSSRLNVSCEFETSFLSTMSVNVAEMRSTGSDTRHR